MFDESTDISERVIAAERTTHHERAVTKESTIDMERKRSFVVVGKNTEGDIEMEIDVESKREAGIIRRVHHRLYPELTFTVVPAAKHQRVLRWTPTAIVDEQHHNC